MNRLIVPAVNLGRALVGCMDFAFHSLLCAVGLRHVCQSAGGLMELLQRLLLRSRQQLVSLKPKAGLLR